MTQRQLRIVEPDDLPGPRIDTDSATVLAEATELLARLRTPYWLGDSGVRLHALASLTAEAQRQLPTAIRDARDQDLGCGTRSPSSSTSHPPPQDAEHTRDREPLDEDHPHNAEMSIFSPVAPPADQSAP